MRPPGHLAPPQWALQHLASLQCANMGIESILLNIDINTIDINIEQYIDTHDKDMTNSLNNIFRISPPRETWWPLPSWWRLLQPTLWSTSRQTQTIAGGHKLTSHPSLPPKHHHQSNRKAFVQDVKNISGLIEIVFASLCEETPWQRLVLNYFLFNIFAFYVQSYHAQGWTTPTALRSVRHSVVELVHPALSIVTTTKVHHQALSPDTTTSSSRTHTTSCSSVWAASWSDLNSISPTSMCSFDSLWPTFDYPAPLLWPQLNFYSLTIADFFSHLPFQVMF